MAIPSEFPFLYHGWEIIMHSILGSVANLLVRHIVFVGNVQKSHIASHLFSRFLDLKLRKHIVDLDLLDKDRIYK